MDSDGEGDLEMFFARQGEGVLVVDWCVDVGCTEGPLNKYYFKPDGSFTFERQGNSDLTHMAASMSHAANYQ